VNHQFDLIVVGAGSGGYAAARTARELGASVALVDRGPLGGLCILRGCMPSKTLIATGDLAHEIRNAAELGVHAGAPAVDPDTEYLLWQTLVGAWLARALVPRRPSAASEDPGR